MVNQRRRVLLVFPELPYPARQNGVSIRYAPVVEHMAQKHDIDVAIIVRPGGDGDLGDLRNICNKVMVHERKVVQRPLLWRAFTRILACFPLGVPYPIFCYDRKEIEGFLRQILRENDYDSVVWISSWYTDLAIELVDSRRLVFDAVDSIYHAFVRENNRNLFFWPDSARLRAWEKKVIKHAKASIYVSKTDTSLFKRDAALADKVHLIPNGIYLGDFTTGSAKAAPSAQKVIGFLGNMAYGPNIAAVLRLEKIFRKLQARDDGFELLVIGRDPDPAIKALAGNGVIITGTVDNIWPVIEKVDYFIFPMVSGAGQQNKVLEAMYAQKVVVCNGLANSGIGGEHGQDLVLCESDEQFVEAILELKRSPERAAQIAQRAHDFVQRQFCWNNTLPRIEQLWFS